MSSKTSSGGTSSSSGGGTRLLSFPPDFGHVDINRELTGHSKKIHCVAWNADGRKLASGSVDCTARVWSFSHHGHNKETEFRGHKDSVEQIVWNPNHAEQIATASPDKTVCVWDIRSTKCLHNISTPGHNIYMSWSPDGKYIAIAAKDDTISVIDTATWKVLDSYPFQAEVNEIAFSGNSSLLMVTTGAGTVEVISTQTFKNVYTIPAHTSNCTCIKFDSSYQKFAVGSADASISLWDTEEFMCERSFNRLSGAVRCLSFSCDGRILAAASEDAVIDISNVETGEELHTIVGKENSAFNTLAWHPRHYLLAYAGDETQRSSYAQDRYMSAPSQEKYMIRLFGFSSSSPPAATTSTS